LSLEIGDRITVAVYNNMKIVHDPVKTLRNEIETWDTPFVELDCFGTDDAERIVPTMYEFCRVHLGSSLRGYLFYGSSVGSTHGVQDSEF
jgi:hypothetical protein